MKEECCGMHLFCEKTGQYNGPVETDYYEDEELDRFRERESSKYNDEEINEFREIMYTMRKEEVPAWVGSLGVRGISIPDELKEEVAMIINS